MAYSEWYQGYLRQEHEEALRRERGASRQHATFSQKSPAPRMPTVQEQLAALSTVIYAARKAAVNREEAEMRVAQSTLAQPFKLCGDSIYKRRAAEVQAHRLAASQGLPKQPEKQVAPVMPDADSIYRKRALQTKGFAA